MRLIAYACLALALLPTIAIGQATSRIFDIVPPAGAEVEVVDGLTVLRQKGTNFAVVLTYMPEDDTHGWIPLAVLNTGAGPLKVGTDGVTLRTGDAPLKVWSATGLIRWLKDGRTGVPPVGPGDAPPASSTPRAATESVGTQAPIAPSMPSTIGQPWGVQTQGGSYSGLPNAPKVSASVTISEERARVDAARERLFRDEKLAPRAIGRGDVLFALPPRGAAAPAEFVVTLSFGGESMDVLYRERGG